MSTPTLDWREPTVFTAGDALIFNRGLHDYPASAGWSLLYEIRGQGQRLEFASTADGDNHSINVPAANTLAWQPGETVLVGFVVNATAERHQFYYGSLRIVPNAQTAPADVDETTHYQRMVALLEAMMEGKAVHDLKMSRIEQTIIERIDPMQVADVYARYKQLRENEIDGQRARNGQPSRNKVRPQFCIVAPGAGLAGWPYGSSFPRQ